MASKDERCERPAGERALYGTCARAVLRLRHRGPVWCEVGAVPQEAQRKEVVVHLAKSPGNAAGICGAGSLLGSSAGSGPTHEGGHEGGHTHIKMRLAGLGIVQLGFG